MAVARRGPYDLLQGRSAVPSDDDPHAATRLLWSYLAEPRSTVDAAQALFGIKPEVTRQLIGAVLATAPEAEHLLNSMPKTLRALAIATTVTPVRCQGELRGAVLWSETLSARAGTAGDTDVYVCASAARAYDTPENRVLVAALQAITTAARAAEPIAGAAWDEEVLGAARINGDRARHYLEHRTLGTVRRKKPDARALQKTRAGTRRRNYEPAMTMLERQADPVSIDHLLAFSHPRTAWQHWVLMALAQRLRQRGHPLPRFRTTPSGDLRAGRLLYRHPDTAANAQVPLHGILFERLLIDVPDPIDNRDTIAGEGQLAARAGGRVPVLVTSESDIERAVDLALGSLA